MLYMTLYIISGVGPAGHLKDVGIDVVHDLQGVGSNLVIIISISLFLLSQANL